ncbi:hypothetical protein J567_4202, partial [Acinetobacter baumannii 754286]
MQFATQPIEQSEKSKAADAARLVSFHVKQYL